MSQNLLNAEPASAFPAGLHAARLEHLQVVRITGADAVDFLQGQLTQDVARIAGDEARLAAYCSAKGRMLASMVVWRAPEGAAAPDGDALYAMLDASVLDAFIKRIRMFVLRAKVSFEPLSSVVSGVWADSADDAQAFAAWAGELPGVAWKRTEAAGGTFIAAPLPAVGPVSRWWHIGEPAALPVNGAASAETWRSHEIEAGLPWVTQPIQEVLTPLMANFELIGGVDFTKGCYPGQEVVARSYYRGKQKRRVLLGRMTPSAADAGELVGVDVFDANTGGEAFGRVIGAASTAASTHLLFEAPFANAAAADLRVGSPSGPSVVLGELPYSLEPET